MSRVLIIVVVLTTLISLIFTACGTTESTTPSVAPPTVTTTATATATETATATATTTATATVTTDPMEDAKEFYQDQVIELIVDAPAGSGPDRAARALHPYLEQVTGATTSSVRKGAITMKRTWAVAALALCLGVTLALGGCLFGGKGGDDQAAPTEETAAPSGEDTEAAGPDAEGPPGGPPPAGAPPGPPGEPSHAAAAGAWPSHVKHSQRFPHATGPERETHHPRLPGRLVGAVWSVEPGPRVTLSSNQKTR